jgi:hypothetical protein
MKIRSSSHTLDRLFHELLRLAALFWLIMGPVGNQAAAAEKLNPVPKWSRFERTFKSTIKYANAPQQAELRVVFTSPSGQSTIVDGFWDGGQSWKVRFSPNELGNWFYSTACSDPKNEGLGKQSGRFTCIAPRHQSKFEKHGPVRVSRQGWHLEHEDGTPFFWLADTAWNGPLRSSEEGWNFYIEERKRQRFTAVQWVATQWRGAPDGDGDSQAAFTGLEEIRINPKFFQRMDQKVEALDRAGLLSVPVLLWAIGAGSNSAVDPGFILPESEAVLLARHMVARWGANNCVWLLGGGGDYRGSNSERWKNIGSEVFRDGVRGVAGLHPGGTQWVRSEFAEEEWFGIAGYQSGHGDNEKTWQWLLQGPPATDWKRGPAHPFINLEPPYEGIVAYHSKQLHTADNVRRAIYWSLLVAPTAGVSYGGHGVWGWDDGSAPTANHPDSGIGLPWHRALRTPAAEQMIHLAGLFTSIDFWRLRPSPEILVEQPGNQHPHRHIAAARSARGDLLVVYTPEDGEFAVAQSSLPRGGIARWFNPRTGQDIPAQAVLIDTNARYTAPGSGDWVLLVEGR